MINTNTNNLQDWELAAMQRMPATIKHDGGTMSKTGKYTRHASRLPIAKYSDGTNAVWVSIVGKILETNNAS